MERDNTCYEIHWGHKPTLFPAKMYVFAISKPGARKSIRDRWHGHEYACDTKITKVVKKDKDFRPWNK
jgi:hypothetical protein